MPGKVRVQFCHFCFAAPSIQNTWRKILLPPRRAAKVRADARPPAACTPARVVRGRLPTWGAGRARWQPGAPKQVFPFPGPPGPELKTVFIALEMKFVMRESYFLSYNYCSELAEHAGRNISSYSLGSVTPVSRTSFPKL